MKWVLKAVGVVSDTSVMLRRGQRLYNGLTDMFAHRQQCREEAAAINTSELDRNPPSDPQLDLAPSTCGEAQGSELIPSTGPGDSEVMKPAGHVSQNLRRTTPEQEMPRGNIVDHGVNAAQANDQDIKQKLVPRGMQVQNVPTLHVDRAVSARSEPAGTRVPSKARERFILEIHNLTEKRNNVLDFRYKVQEARASLKRDREAQSTLDVELLQKASLVVANGNFTELGSLLGLLEDLQKSRDNLKPKEDDYEILEGRLNRQEWELKEMERKLFPEGSNPQPSLFGDEDIARFEKHLEEANSSPSTSPTHIEDPPLVEQYLSRKGDAEILKEQLLQMSEEQAQVLEKKEIRARVGLDLDADSQAILDSFDGRFYALQQELENVEEDISRLQEALTNKDDMFFSTALFDTNGQGPSSVDTLASYVPDLSYLGDVEGIPADTEPLQKDLLLVSDDDDDNKHDMLRSSDCSTREAISTPRYINRWILHRLRRSRSEVRLFRSTKKFRDAKVELSQEDFKKAVLDWWFKDQSADDYEKSRASANSIFDISVATNAKQFRSSTQTRSDCGIPSRLEPILQAREDQILESYTSTYDPPVQAFDDTLAS